MGFSGSTNFQTCNILHECGQAAPERAEVVGWQRDQNIWSWFHQIFFDEILYREWYYKWNHFFEKLGKDAMLLNEVTKKIAESKWTVNRLHAEAPRAEATPVVPEAPEAPEAPVAVEPSAPPARGHGCAGIKDQITFHRTVVFEHFFRCQKCNKWTYLCHFARFLGPPQ